MTSICIHSSVLWLLSLSLLVVMELLILRMHAIHFDLEHSDSPLFNGCLAGISEKVEWHIVPFDDLSQGWVVRQWMRRKQILEEHDNGG